MGKVVVVGLDGAPLDLVRPWIEQGKLPTLRRLLREGASGPMRSVVHPYTAQAWTTMVTGVNAGRHRLFDFWERDLEIYGFHLTNASMRAAPAVWSWLNEAGCRTIVVNVPMTFPPESVDGVMIAGRDSPGLSSAFTYPPQLKAELEQVLQRPYVIVPGDWRWMRLGRPEKASQELLDEVDVRFEVVRHLTTTRPWDFCMFVVGATDGAAHFFWRQHERAYPTHDPALFQQQGDVLLQVYQRVDEHLGTLMANLDDDTSIVVVSDHGSGRREPYAFHLNAWLAERGWLSFVDEGERGASLGDWTAKGVKALKELAYNLLPYQQLTRARKLWPERWRRGLSRYELFSGIDWRRTRAFSEERRGSIWINVRGREPEGIVEPGEEYDALRAEIAEGLQAVRNPETNEPVARRVWRREELFDGPYLERIPDLLLEVASPACFMRYDRGNDGPSLRTLTAQDLSKLDVNGDHRMDGTLVVWGPGIRPGHTLDRTDIRDVFPTVCYLMGVAIPDDIEGALAEDAFRPDWIERHTPRVEHRSPDADSPETRYYSEDEAREVEDRLAGLGYLG
ncbi:MAG: hypothetical protein GX601_07505 [Anaerolineales bacterium]|nr:hypothetical protein [Anaerolineales bacterium]